MPSVHYDVMYERAKQEAKWGCQNHVTPAQWLAILTEEVGEVAKEVADARLADFRPEEYRQELVQVAAVAVAAVEALDFQLRPEPVWQSIPVTSEEDEAWDSKGAFARTFDAEMTAWAEQARVDCVRAAHTKASG